MFSHLRYWLIGPPLPTHDLAHKRLNKIRALAAFSPDALSSIAYANQEIYLGLVIAGSSGLAFSFPIGICISVLLCIVALSYFQTIHGYPSGGGSYVVAKENLGELPGLLAGAALLIDYVLTAAVSLTAGVEAIASAFPILWDYRVELALFLLALITMLNLRGLQETGTVMAIPVYTFLITYGVMLVAGFIRAMIEGPALLSQSAPAAIQPLSLMIVIRAFTAGSTALTGIEAISNGVPVFKPPESKNAGKTLIAMAFLMGFLFLGSLGLTQYFAVTAGPQETILSALAEKVVGRGFYYYLVQASTLLILTVAANTSFVGFPRITYLLARDGYLPRQLSNLGDRLVYSNGMLLLAGATALLIVAFNGVSHALVPLFAVGAFLAFTLSQAGMVNHWKRLHNQSWLLKSLINSLGATTTGIMVLVVGISKFSHGAWITLVMIPSIVWIFLQIKRHYRKVGQQLTLRGLPPSLRPAPKPRLVLLVSGIQRATIESVNYARSISEQVTALYVEIEPGSGAQIYAKWTEWFPDIPLVVVASPFRTIVGPVLAFLDQTDAEHNDGQLAAVVLPEIITAHPWEALLHNQTARLIKNALLYRRRNMGYQRLIIDIPYHLKD
jgi:amino acid transporter